MKLKTLFLSLILSSSTVIAMADGIYTRQCDDAAKKEQCTDWVESGAWRNGFEKADAHESVNAVDFYEQYSKNKEQWNAMFKWLEDTDLLAISAEKYPIEGTTLVASVEDSQNRPLEKSGTEDTGTWYQN